MIRLGIDARHVPIDGSPGAGVAHASRELAEAIQDLAQTYGIACIEWRGRMRAWELARRCRRERVHALLVTSGSVPPLLPIPAYPWVHDVAIFRHPEWFPQSRWKRCLTMRLFLRGIRNAPHVFAVSEDAKRTLLSVADIDAERVTVTYQGVRMTVDSNRIHGSKHPYAVIVGTIEPRKNILFLVSLWEDVRRRWSDAELVIAGRQGWGNVRIPVVPGVRHVQAPSDKERDALLAGARALLFPSLYEGFGRPALEAMTLGVPVVASNRGAIPEVVGDAGILLDPHDREGWIAAIDRAFRGELNGESGNAQARRFSWEKTARTILVKIRETC